MVYNYHAHYNGTFSEKITVKAALVLNPLMDLSFVGVKNSFEKVFLNIPVILYYHYAQYDNASLQKKH